MSCKTPTRSNRAAPQCCSSCGATGRGRRRHHQLSQRVAVSPPVQLSRPLPPFMLAVLVVSAESRRSLPLPPSIVTVSLFWPPSSPSVRWSRPFPPLSVASFVNWKSVSLPLPPNASPPDQTNRLSLPWLPCSELPSVGKSEVCSSSRPWPPLRKSSPVLVTGLQQPPSPPSR